LRFPGDLDRAQAASVWEEARVLAHAGEDVIIDFRDTSRCDVSVLQVLLALDVSLREAGKTLKATGVSDTLAEQMISAGCHAFVTGEHR
jgi:anti-anti-sigma regulatory factor